MFRASSAHLQEDTVVHMNIRYCHSVNRWMVEYY